MARSVKRAWDYRRDNPDGGDKELRKVAEDKIRERNETDLQHLVHLQGKEIKSLESEKVWIDKERARDVQTMNDKEIAAINQRYDRLGTIWRGGTIRLSPRCRVCSAAISASRPVSTSSTANVTRQSLIGRSSMWTAKGSARGR